MPSPLQRTSAQTTPGPSLSHPVLSGQSSHPLPSALILWEVRQEGWKPEGTLWSTLKPRSQTSQDEVEPWGGVAGSSGRLPPRAPVPNSPTNEFLEHPSHRAAHAEAPAVEDVHGHLQREESSLQLTP